MESFFLISFLTSERTFNVVYNIFAAGGWVVLVGLLFYAGFYMLYTQRRKNWTKDWNYVLLAVDIPLLNVQTPKAVEQLFTHIFSVMEPPSIGYKYWRGFYQYQYSFEIISIEGYIQFLIRVLDKYRDVVEAAVYAQYPDAEITEVEDYVNSVPDHYPNDTHKLWAADFTLTEHYAYPLRLYEEFEHSIAEDTVLKDPMGTFLESFSRIGPGEQMWYQIIIEPIQEYRWKKECIAKIKEEIGEKKDSGGGIFGFLFDNPLTQELGKGIGEVVTQLGGGIRSEDSAASKKDNGPPNQILYLTPGQKKSVEGMENKISKLGYKTKVRAIYVARKEVYNPARGVNSLVGAINQFNNPYSNMLLPKYITSTQYLFKKKRDDYRRNLLMRAYKKRNPWVGKKRFILNVEELATIWHFPMSHVKTPLVQKAAAKVAEPPIGLPMESVPGLPVIEEPVEEEKPKKFRTDTGEEIRYDEI